jgi:hypothetical protein
MPLTEHCRDNLVQARGKVLLEAAYSHKDKNTKKNDELTTLIPPGIWALQSTHKSAINSTAGNL